MTLAQAPGDEGTRDHHHTREHATAKLGWIPASNSEQEDGAGMAGGMLWQNAKLSKKYCYNTLVSAYSDAYILRNLR